MVTVALVEQALKAICAQKNIISFGQNPCWTSRLGNSKQGNYPLQIALSVLRSSDFVPILDEETGERQRNILTSLSPPRQNNLQSFEYRIHF